jgi:hypothetical protein
MAVDMDRSFLDRAFEATVAIAFVFMELMLYLQFGAR